MTDRIMIEHPQEPGRPTTISATHFNPEVHVRWSEQGLPDDFPGKEALEAAGYRTVDAVRGIPDLDAVPGIGQVTEAKIIAYLEAEE